MKKIMIFMLIGTMSANSLIAFAGTNQNVGYDSLKVEEELEFQNVEVDDGNYVLKFEMINNRERSVTKIEYDGLEEIIKIDDVIVNVKTELVSKPEGDTRNDEVILLEHKIRSFNEVKNRVNGTKGVNVDAFIPSNAPYNSYNFTKTISNIIGDINKCADVLSKTTAILAFLSGIPLPVVLGSLKVISDTITESTNYVDGIVGGTWSYQQHVTKNQYKIGIITDYGYRYAHSKLDINLKIGSKKGYKSTVYNKNGNWYTNRKPW